MTVTLIIVLAAVLFIGLGWKVSDTSYRRGLITGYDKGWNDFKKLTIEEVDRIKSRRVPVIDVYDYSKPGQDSIE